MEFKFRAIDEQASTYLPPPPLPPPPSIGYFSDQARRAGYTNYINPSDVREAIHREIEKERIREEIIAAEIARRRVLEAEVRREMMMEREMALRRGGGGRGVEGFSIFSGSASMLFEPRLPLLHQSEYRSLEERLALSLEERLGYRSRREFGGFETVPFQRISEPKISEVKPTPSEVSKEKVIFLAKPEGNLSEGNLSGAKRKAVTPPVVAGNTSELPSAGLKKLKEEWSCAMCQVTATSESGLNEHLQGKKHKSREAGLRALRTGKNYAIGLFPKKTAKPIISAETITEDQNLVQEEKKEGESLQVNKTGVTLLPKKPNAEDVKQNNHKKHLKNQGKSNSMNKNGDLAKKMQKIGDDKKKFRFWCEMCQVGAFSEKVMDNHKNGKKHVGKLQELNENSGPAAAAQVEEASQKEKENPEVVVKDKEETMENADGVVGGETVENNQAAEDSAVSGTD